MTPLILVTNDDGIDSHGLRAAAAAVAGLGDVLVAAPLREQTGMGRSFPRSDTGGIIETRGGGDIPVHAVHGSPAQAVAHAVLELAPRRPALCISGVNNGENLGGTCFISGTVGAAAEAAGFDIPALAVSLDSTAAALFVGTFSEAGWAAVTALIRRFARQLLRDGLPPGVDLVNVNIPASANARTEVRTTWQAGLNHYACVAPSPRDLTRPCRLPVSGDLDPARLEPGSDLHAFLVDRVISATPLGRDLTARDATGAPHACLPRTQRR